METRPIVKEFLQELLRRKGASTNFFDNDSLMNSGLLDSVDTLELVVFLEERYGVDFADRGFDRDELDSVDSILALIANR